MCIKSKGGRTGLERKEGHRYTKTVVVPGVGGEGLGLARVTQGAPGVLAAFCSLIWVLSLYSFKSSWTI